LKEPSLEKYLEIGGISLSGKKENYPGKFNGDIKNDAQTTDHRFDSNDAFKILLIKLENLDL
jgi:hypothetical protein